MEIKKRIIPIFTYKNNVFVKSVKFSNYRNVNSIKPVIRLFNKRNIDEMIFLNLEDKINYNLLESFVDDVDYPITYGGSIDSIEVMQKIYNIGFDKINLNSILYKDPSFSIKASELFGKQSITASIDVKKINNEYYCFYNNGKINSNKTIQQHIDEIILSNSISELIITNIDNEGTYNGFDEELYNLIKDKNIRILVNGGGNFNIENILNVVENKNVYGLCFSSLFFFKQYTPNDIKKVLYENGIPCVNYI